MFRFERNTSSTDSGWMGATDFLHIVSEPNQRKGCLSMVENEGRLGNKLLQLSMKYGLETFSFRLETFWKPGNVGKSFALLVLLLWTFLDSDFRKLRIYS
ncbi:unnamed protein product [Orchesella dallaii]|uniref:Uncharacterized protein n=1 Tax=Orchesella dallaii TaxID=48710 RepID=A0ABP1RX58_9HEXA